MNKIVRTTLLLFAFIILLVLNSTEIHVIPNLISLLQFLSRLKSYFFIGFPTPTFPACLRALGLESGAIPYSAISASSEIDIARKAANARLHFQGEKGRIGGWTSRINDEFQWLEVNFGNWTSVGRVAIQGRHAVMQWVSTFSLSFGFDGVFFDEYKEEGHKKVHNHVLFLPFISQLLHR